MARTITAGTSDHEITIAPFTRRVAVRWKGKAVAETRAALALKEASYPVVNYVPRADADMTMLKRTTHTTHCPYKGDASYYSLVTEGAVSENAVWSYESPLPGMEAIKGYLAFYPNRVDAIEEG
jgi:uncharacterized protein (DUF427 family)